MVFTPSLSLIALPAQPSSTLNLSSTGYPHIRSILFPGLDHPSDPRSPSRNPTKPQAHFLPTAFKHYPIAKHPAHRRHHTPLLHKLSLPRPLTPHPSHPSHTLTNPNVQASQPRTPYRQASSYDVHLPAQLSVQIFPSYEEPRHTQNVHPPAAPLPSRSSPTPDGRFIFSAATHMMSQHRLS